MSQSAVISEQAYVSLTAVWTLREFRIVVVWKPTGSTGVVRPLRNTDRRMCCVTVEQNTSPCRSSVVGAYWGQRWADSRLPDTSVHCRIDTGRPGQRPWIELVVARTTSAVVAELAWCDHGAAHQLKVARQPSGRIVRDASAHVCHAVVHCNSPVQSVYSTPTVKSYKFALCQCYHIALDRL